ncbi:MAG: PP2C family protein-serine/threonine phosphatase [Candidatus Anammoxibacter sp.]
MDNVLKNNKVLVVDDEPKNLKLLQVRLKSVGYEVSTAVDGFEGYEIAQKLKPAIIVSDLMMPRVDGVEFLKKIRADESLKDVGFILLTARDTHESTVEGLSVGADDYITKPFDTEELFARIKTNIRVSNLQEEIKEKNKLLEEKINELVKKDKKIQDDLDAAKVLQQALLPVNFPENESLKFGIKYQPTDKVGGDIYDIFEIDKNNVGILMSDVSGQGVPAAFLAAMARMAIVNNERYYFSPALLLQTVNEQLCANIKTEYYLNMFYVVLNTKSKILLFSKNSHPNAFVFRQNSGTLEQLTTEAIMIGNDEKARFEEKETKIDKGDKILLLSNGVSNCFKKSEGQNVFNKVQGIAKNNCSLPIQELVDKLFQETLSCSAMEDTTILGIEIL